MRRVLLIGTSFALSNCSSRRLSKSLAFSTSNHHCSNSSPKPAKMSGFEGEWGHVMDYWFPRGEDGSLDKATSGKRHWSGAPAIDQEVRDKFAADWLFASQGKFKHWEESPRSCLALVILLDQVPRNMFRHNGGMFSTDAKALGVTLGAIERGFDRELDNLTERMFLYLPLMHSEELTHQEICIQKFQELADADSSFSTAFAVKHADIIRKYNRFPHRNKLLGRESTPEEEEFLTQPGSSF